MMQKENRWLIYGAYGYTGVLVAEEAIRRGHKPVLAGRSAEKLADFDLIFHAAGPFIHTSAPMVHACLQSGTHYLDITGEVPVFAYNFTLDQQAKDQGIAIISGVGFDVVPSDCLAKYLSDKVVDAQKLEIAFASPDGTTSPGTTKSMLEYLSRGVFARKIMAIAFLRRLAQKWVEKNVKGPDVQTRASARCYFWATVANEKGESAEAWLETPEGYQLTAVAGVRCVEKVFAQQPKGVLTPAMAFGADFVLEIPGVERIDSMEDSDK